MNYLNVENISKSYGEVTLFENISFSIHKGQKIAFIAKNGTGKTSILKIISGEDTSDSGEITCRKNIVISFLSQDPKLDENLTIEESIFNSNNPILKVIENYEKALLNSEDAENYQKAFEEMELFQAWDFETQYKQILSKLKLDKINQKVSELSGGQKKRLSLANALINRPDLLILDEPTNHLDIEAIIWLENFLKSYAGAIVIVSHDKMFLDNVTNRTIEISLGKIYDYPKPYTQYLVLRNEIRTQQLASQKNQAKQIAQTEKLIEKFRAKASKATMAQSLIKKLEKVDRIEVDKDDNSVMKLNFPVSITPGKIVIEALDVSKNYDELSVLKNISLSVDRGSKIAFVGQNGQGKSTLAKIIVGDIKSEGVVKLGHNVQIGYFAQNQAEYLDGSKTVLDTMIDSANEKNRSKVRDILGSFLFKGDDADKFVRVLSGGERNRLALAKLLLQPLNVLIMDEPTNHLDIKSKNVLKVALSKFEGTLLLVSHDRDFLQGLVDKVYEFKDKKLNEYLGDIDYYLDEKKLENMREVELKTKIKVEKPVDNKLSYNNQKKLKSLNNKLSKVESSIGMFEREIKELDGKLESDYDKYANEKNFFDIYHSKKNNLNTLMKDWELIQNDLEKLSE